MHKLPLQKTYYHLPKVIILLLLLMYSATSAFAAPPKRFIIDALSLKNEDQALSIDLALSVDEEDGLRDLLKDGAVIELKVNLKVERRRSWWANADIAEREYVSIIRHDPLSREFYLSMPDEKNLYRDRNLSRLLMETWQNLHLPLIPLQRIEDEGLDNTFIIHGEASLTHMEVPPWLAGSSFWSSEIIPKATFSLEYRSQ